MQKYPSAVSQSLSPHHVEATFPSSLSILMHLCIYLYVRGEAEGEEAGTRLFFFADCCVGEHCRC